MNRPLAVPLLPLAGKDAFQNDLIRTLSSFFFDVVNQLNSQVQGVGQTVASADEVFVSASVQHVSGTGTIKTLTAPPGFTGPIWLIADDNWSLVTGGNIGHAAQAEAGKAMTVIYDGSTWYPS